MSTQVYSGHARKPDSAFHLEVKHPFSSRKREERDLDVLRLHVISDPIGQVERAEGPVVREGHLLKLIHHSHKLQFLLMDPLRNEQICKPNVNGTPFDVLFVQVHNAEHLQLELVLGGVDSLILAPELGQLLEGLPFKEALDVGKSVRRGRPFIPKHSQIFHLKSNYNKQGRAMHHGKGAWTTTRDRATGSLVIFNFT